MGGVTIGSQDYIVAALRDCLVNLQAPALSKVAANPFLVIR